MDKKKTETREGDKLTGRGRLEGKRSRMQKKEDTSRVKRVMRRIRVTNRGAVGTLLKYKESTKKTEKSNRTKIKIGE